MNKSIKNAHTEAPTPLRVLQTKRYDDVFKRQAVERWLQTDKPGPPIAANWASVTRASRNGSVATMGTPSRNGRLWRRRTAPSRQRWPGCESCGTF